VKKFNFSRGLNIVLVFVLIGIVSFQGIKNVYARMLTIDEVNEEFNNIYIVEFNKVGAKISTAIDTTNKVLNIYNDGEIAVSFNYTDEYIEYDNRNAVISDETLDDNLNAMLMLIYINQSILNLSGYEDKTLTTDSSDIEDDFTKTYDTYGLQVETEPYEFEDGNYSESGDFIRYYKISLDTDKIAALVEKYGVDKSNINDNTELAESLTPTLEVKKITENSVTLYPHVDSTATMYCYIYRSTSENGTYEKISYMAVNCTTYYYKAIVMDGTKYSDVLKITTNSSDMKYDEKSNTGEYMKIGYTSNYFEVMYNDSEYGYQTYKKEYSDNLVREAFVSNSALTTGEDLSFIVILESGEVYQGNYTDKTGWVYDRILNDYSILSIESINFTSEGLNLEATSLDGTKIKIANGILENSNSKDGIENPQTGVFLPISLILLGTTLSGGIYFYTKKKNIFHKI
jgi:hypothetical protein